MAKSPKITTPKADWSMPPTNDRGQQLASDGLPMVGLARAMALAEAGTKTDPLEIVTSEQIAAHDFKGVQADLDALAGDQETEAGGQPSLPSADPFAPPPGDASTNGTGE